jgi:hypothetical protein
MKRLLLIVLVSFLFTTPVLSQPGVWLSAGEPGYALNDRFVVDRAAGAVNGTSAEPGPGGNRIVVDPGNNISVLSGFLQFSGGDGEWGTEYREAGIARQAGQVYTFGVRSTSVPVGVFVGLSGNTSGLCWDQLGFHFVLGADPVIYLWVNGILNGTVGTMSSLTDYKFRIVVKAAGYDAYIKGGSEYPIWTIVHSGVAGTGATLYPTINCNTAIITVDSIQMAIGWY